MSDHARSTGANGANNGDRTANDKLADLLQDCAEMVRQGNHDHPVLSKTLEAFLFYMEQPPNNATRSNSVSHKPPPTMGGMLGKMMGMGSDSAVTHEPPKTTEQKAATSRKNAERLKADLQESSGRASPENGTKSKPSLFSFPPIPGFTDGEPAAKSKSQEPRRPSASAAAATTTEGNDAKITSRAEFQRPANPKSALIANGWIEQQRRSRMRTVWKDVLASLVEGRKKGEETTLWIQRQVVNPQTNQSELEALHQIPVKWLEEVTYFDYSADNRFSLKVYNLQEEFIFRCPKDSEAANNWVTTLLAAKEGKLKKKKSKSAKSSDWETASNTSSNPEKKKKLTTSKSKSKEKDKVGKKHHEQHGRHSVTLDEEEKKSADHPSHNNNNDSSPTAAGGEGGKHHSVKELRAIAHGAGIQTAGMERGELEAVVAQITASQNSSERSPPSSAVFVQRQKEEQERLRIEKERYEYERRIKEEQQRRAAEEEEARRKAAEEARLREEMEREQRRRQEEEAETARLSQEAQKAAAEQEEIRRRTAERVHLQQEAERRRREEEERARLERERREQEEAEHRRRVAEMQERERQEQIRKQQEEYGRQQRLWQEQQAAQAEAARQQRLKEEQEARAREEHIRRQRQAEQWAQQQAPQQAHPHAYHAQQQQQQQYQQQHQQQPRGPPPNGYPQQQQQQHSYSQQNFHHPGQQQQQYSQQQAYYAQQQQHQPSHAQAPPPQHHQAPPQNHQPPPPQSSVNQKYAKMANDDDGAAANKQIKHGLLVHWALQPPMLQALKPIEALITTVHTVFPPSFGVAGHDYFKKWKAVLIDDISTGPPQNQIDTDKLNKSVRKLRFFLHPDKLPKDLSGDQSFLIKLLWDITNDAFEEYKKKEEDLGWIRG